MKEHQYKHTRTYKNRSFKHPKITTDQNNRKRRRRGGETKRINVRATKKMHPYSSNRSFSVFFDLLCETKNMQHKLKQNNIIKLWKSININTPVLIKIKALSIQKLQQTRRYIKTLKYWRRIISPFLAETVVERGEYERKLAIYMNTK